MTSIPALLRLAEELAAHGGAGLALIVVGAALAGLGIATVAVLRAAARAAQRALPPVVVRAGRPGRGDSEEPAVQHRPDAPGRRLPRAPGSMPATV
ncbi:DUF6412 domain-containing protein [Herbiconiux sp. L3-i23]|uniref:DUF6412 domain-containing protein n=1 Tax=Herbiconiux sp. L3-i23 TaxID=2905871 RepID=UPI002072F2E0|nr:DUF6412 domain-containing protein [Herbiconiux sp. L3-i23]